MLDGFTREVGPAAAGPVVALGGRTQWDVGGQVAHGTREVTAPAGIAAYEPAEMTVRVRAGTRVADLGAALIEGGQCVTLPSWPGATVGGVLAVGRSGVRRLGWGPVRDAVLEIRYVSAEGDLVTGGGPTVKNVSGFDVPRLLVGSLGTLGLMAEVVLRTRPVPAVERWFSVADRDPFALLAALYRPASVLWDGATTWVLLDGHPTDVATQAAATGLEGHEVEGPPPLPPHRWSLRPGELRTLVASNGFVAEVGVGTVHRHVPPPTRLLAPAVARLNQRIKALFDPIGRLAPGRVVA